MDRLIQFEYKFHIGKREIQSVLNYCAAMRILFFRQYPYLYVGCFEGEKEYLDQYTEDSHAIIISIEHNQDIIGIATGIPFERVSKGFGDVEDKFTQIGASVADLFYIGEIIIRPEFQGKSLSPKLFEKMEGHARDCGFTGITFCNVIRAKNHIMRPTSYNEIDFEKTFAKKGYLNTQITTKIEYPTLTTDQSVKKEKHEMVFWLKRFNG